jgi:hypothetical protein
MGMAKTAGKIINAMGAARRNATQQRQRHQQIAAL